MTIAAIAITATLAGCTPAEHIASTTPPSAEARQGRTPPTPVAPSASSSNTHANPSSSPSPTNGFVPPAWFEEVVREGQRFGHELYKCSKLEGADVAWNAQDGFGINAREGVGVDPKTQAIVDKCSKQLSGSPVVKDLEHWRTAYDKLLVIKECFEAHGLNFSKPPSRDKWAKALLAGKGLIWNPVNDLHNPELNGWGSDAALFELEDACPIDAFFADVGI